jgi:CRP/FNR family transcriptional regulator
VSYVESIKPGKERAFGGKLPLCELCPVRGKGICNALDASGLAQLRQISRRRFVPDGDVICHEGDEVDFYFTIVFGAVKLSKCLRDGGQHIVSLLYPPCFYGHNSTSQHLYSAHAACDTELCIYPRGPFERFLERNSSLQRRVLEMTMFELDHQRERTLMLARKNSYERVASFLLTVIDHVYQIGCGEVKGNVAHLQLPFTRAEMADYLGLTVETVSRQLAVLKRDRTVVLRSCRDVVVPDIKLLSVIAGAEKCLKREAASENRPQFGTLPTFGQPACN